MFNLGLGNSAPTVGLSALREATRRVNTSFERLATGKRINRASDDPSGMVAVESLKAQEITLREKIKSNEAQQQWTGARDGALSVLGDLFTDLEGLVQQGANSAGLSTQEKRGIQDQIDSILNTVDYLSNTVTFKGEQLMQGRNRTSFGIAELASGGKLNILSGNLEDAQKAATALTEAHPELSAAWITRGDILRQREDYAAAIPAYSRALDLIEAGDGEARWFPLYARGIARERSGDFDGAEADMRAALEIRPDQAQILNYLGYSFIDRNMKLDEGLAMVEKAARLRPEDGYIQDSLGWGYYRVGRFQEAVAPMERAATQMSNDPLVNDHLGDVYWMAGRQREAETQWKRALSLALDDTVQDTDNEVDPDRIRAKLERGLDAVLADERAGRPLMPAARSPVGGAGPANGAAAAENGSGRVD